MNALLKDMQNATTPPSDVNKAIPIYRMEGLEIALRDAVEGFQSPWKARLGLKLSRKHSKRALVKAQGSSASICCQWVAK